MTFPIGLYSGRSPQSMTPPELADEISYCEGAAGLIEVDGSAGLQPGRIKSAMDYHARAYACRAALKAIGTRVTFKDSEGPVTVEITGNEIRLTTECGHSVMSLKAFETVAEIFYAHQSGERETIKAAE